VGLAEDGLGNPVALAYKVIESLAMGAGDLLYGASLVSMRKYNLAISSATVARSACEYASTAWFLAEPGISAQRRVTRTAYVVTESLLRARVFLGREEQDQYEADNAQLLDWASRHRPATRDKLPNEVDRFKAMNPEHGRRQYEHLSLLAHGDVAMTLQIVETKATGGNENQLEPVWRVLLSAYHVLAMAARISEIKDRPSARLEQLARRHAEYADLLDRVAATADDAAGE
jgi:hypothetical protein